MTNTINTTTYTKDFAKKNDKITCFLDLVIHSLCFLSILLIGADIWGIKIGVNFRLDQIFLTLLTLCLIINNSYRIRRSIPVFMFLILTFISAVFAFNIVRGFVFYLSILFNTFIIFYCFYSYVSTYGLNKIIKICRKTIYIQTILIVIQFVLKLALGISLPFFTDYGYYFGIPRFCLWFYEPSYFATYFVFWFTFAFYNLIIGKNKDYLKDVLFCGLSILLSTSGTGYVGLVLAVIVIYLIWVSTGISKRKIITLFFIIIASTFVLVIFRDAFNTFVGRIFVDGLSSASGGRIEGWIETFEVFKEHPLFGVGPGNYGLYLVNDSSIVPSNVTLELLSTTGMFATISFYLILLSYVIKACLFPKKAKTNNIIMNRSLVVSLVIFTIILQVNQGYLRLYHWMFFGLIEGSFVICGRELKVSRKEDVSEYRI